MLFLNETGLGKARIGFIISLWPFCGIISPFVSPFVYRFGPKRAANLFLTIRKFALGLIALTPLILARHGVDAAFWWVAGLVFVFGVCRAVAETGVYAWMQDAVPNRVRGRLSAATSVGGTLASIAATALATWIIGRSSSPWRFSVLILIAAVSGLIYVWCSAHLLGGEPSQTARRAGSRMADMRAALRDRNFCLFLIAQPLVSIGSTFTVAFVPLFAKEQVGLAVSQVAMLGFGVSAGSLLSSLVWGWGADRYGSRPVMLGGMVCYALLPAAWMLVRQQSDARLVLALACSFLQGIAVAGWSIGYSRYLFVRVIPPDRRQAYLDVYYPWTEVMSGMGPLTAGALLAWLAARPWTAPWSEYSVLFALGALLVLAALVPILRLRAD
jgi:MFS-type transporter involved in bile tolerance (Atg22 family)